MLTFASVYLISLRCLDFMGTPCLAGLDRNHCGWPGARQSAWDNSFPDPVARSSISPAQAGLAWDVGLTRLIPLCNQTTLNRLPCLADWEASLLQDLVARLCVSLTGAGLAWNVGLTRLIPLCNQSTLGLVPCPEIWNAPFQTLWWCCLVCNSGRSLPGLGWSWLAWSHARKTSHCWVQ